ncbi:MAG TPA: hypothetical protein VK171_01575 [Fimbriimonas sp.]|nr:hypothetical protein [Fimbriimonas sp.]
MWAIALCFTAVWIGLFGWIYRFIAFGEYVHIDENRIELHFLMLQKTIQMADVDRVFDVKNAEGPRFCIKTLTGEKTAIPNRFELVDFIAAARRSYNFKLQEASEENIHKL